MSWDVMIFNLQNNIKSVSELTDDSVISLGSKNEVLSTIRHIFPQANFSDPTWVVLDGKDYSIEFSLGQDEQIEVLMLHVRGSVDALDAIERFCQINDWRAFDSATGDFINFDLKHDEGFKRWTEYRNFIANKYKNDSS